MWYMFRWSNLGGKWRRKYNNREETLQFQTGPRPAMTYSAPELVLSPGLSPELE